MYSQNSEEAVILEHLQGADPATSTFLDIGAWDGRTFSNTLRLVELGWAGLCVEPSPSAFLSLLTTHQFNPRVALLNAAIIPGPEARPVDFHDARGDGVSTLVAQHAQRWNLTQRVFQVHAMPLEALFEHFGAAWTFINLDVEALNKELFMALPLEHLAQLRVICVEHDGHAERMALEAESFGFRVVHTNGENLILAR